MRQNYLSIFLIVFLLFTGAIPLHAQTQPPMTPPAEVPAQVITPAETASSPSTIGSILSNFGADQKAIWTSPFHINHDNAKWWALFGLSTVALIGTDRTTEKAIPYSVSQTAYSRDVSQLGQEYVVLPIAAGFYFYGRAGNHPKSREVGVLGAEAMLDSEILVNILKVAGGRERPNVVGGNGRFFKGQGLNAGFPSGHAIETWTFASVIAHEYGPGKLVPFVVYGLASVVSVARFTGQFHYASDILAGGAMGWFVGTYVWNHHEDPAIHRRYRGVAALAPNHVSPVVMPGSRMYGVHLAWVK
jgi:membrane-associated phospholipid phosphatase